MNKRYTLTVAAWGLILMAPLAWATNGPATAASSGAPIVHKINAVHQKLHDEKTQTQKLRDKVDSLTRQQKADQQQLKQSDATIKRLRNELKKIDKSASAGQQARHDTP